MGPKAVWPVAENLDRTGIRSPDRPAYSESLHRLRYPGPHHHICAMTRMVVKFSLALFVNVLHQQLNLRSTQ